MFREKRHNHSTSWQKVSKWYHHLQGSKGDYFHRLIIPKVLKILSLKEGDSLLDLGCGQGVFSRSLPKNIHYTGVDISHNLIVLASKMNKERNFKFVEGDVTRTLNLPKNSFSHAIILLSLQNISEPQKALAVVSEHLKQNGLLIIVLNHPCFRIPRQTSWGIDEGNKLQYRRINRYLSPLKIPVNVEPSQGQRGKIAWSFHFSLSSLSEFLFNSGFVIEKIEEWVSDKISVGKAGRQENFSREEFPLFLTLVCRKK